MKKYIPDCITSMNLACGIIGVVFAFKGRLDIAFILMLAASVADFLDGLAARLLDSYSPLGKELDSLSDMVSFGVLPSVMLYNLSRICMFGESIVCWIPLIITIASGIRLAKFNVDDRQKDGFLGLPTPACALLAGSLCYFVAADPASFLAQWCAGPVFLPVLSVCLSALLVSEIPMFSLKFHKDDPAAVKGKRMAMAFLVLAAILVCVICGLNWSVIVLLSLTLYILKNLVYAIVKV
ncbi:MAG: CDP-diacylglycerol--serine O-phosphatidyltransferase [Bacteroidales bacterium]|nr:CDP-diacylglycerol--serine O-phosphatidyltransferase [Bacteroidales bacterium]